MLEHIKSITEAEMDFISSRESGMDQSIHKDALKELIFSQDGIARSDQVWYPYEVVELCSNELEEGHEKEFVFCNLLVLMNVGEGADTHTDLAAKLESRKADYDRLSAAHRDLILDNYSLVLG